METIIRPWGRTEVEFQGSEIDEVMGRIRYEYGVNTIRPGGMVELHFENTCSEEYTPLTEGLKIIVLSREEANGLYTPDVLNLLTAMEDAEIGKPIVCNKGFAHAVYCSAGEDCTSQFRYEKFDEIQAEK